MSESVSQSVENLTKKKIFEIPLQIFGTGYE